MKKLFLLLLICGFSFTMKAQFVGGFYYDDPNALFDKDPFFACKNAYVYNGWGQNLQNISIVINDKDWYSYPYVWGYNQYIRIGEESGVEFSSGDVVKLYWGNQCVGSWTYRPTSALSGIKIPKGTGSALKQVWKYVKKMM